MLSQISWFQPDFAKARHAPDQDDRDIRSWLFETAQTRIRWMAAPTTLLTVPFFGTVSIVAAVSLVLLVVAANMWLTRALSELPAPSVLLHVRWIACVADWLLALGSVFLLGAELAAWTPALFLLLIVTTTLRFGAVGLLWSVAVALAGVTGLVLVQELVHRANEESMALVTWVAWALLIVTSAAVSLGLVNATSGYEQWERSQRRHLEEALPRYQLGISKRQAELLPLLANEDLTYREIAEQLHLSPETIKTHVRNLGVKLDVSGRRQVVDAARRNGLLNGQNLDPDGR